MLGWLRTSTVQRGASAKDEATLPPKTLRASLVQTGGFSGTASLEGLSNANLKRSSTYDLEPFGEVLGEGSFGVVKLRRHRQTGESRAVKTVQMPEHWDQTRLTREAEMMQNLDHPHILRIFGWHAGSDFVTMVTEFCEGGELIKAIRLARKRSSLHQGWLAMVFRQLFEAVSYCHDRGVVHRDIKSGNILLHRNVGTDCLFKTMPHVVLVDLGLAAMFQTAKRVFGGWNAGVQDAKMVGTAATMAPEVWSGCHGPKSDVWSLGCVFHEILADKLPYLPTDPEDTSRDTWMRLLKECLIDWSPIQAFGEEAKDLCQRMLTIDESKRPVAIELLSHDWIDRFISSCPRAGGVHTDNLTSLCEAMCHWRDLLPMQKAICLKLASENVGTAKFASIFRQIDTDNSGTLSQQELVDALSSCDFGVPRGLAVQVAEALDYNGDGTCEYLEFAAACLSSLGKEYDEMLYQEFCLLDVACRGQLDRYNFGRLVSKITPLCASRNIPFPDIDTNGDGFINFMEFAEVFGRLDTDYKAFLTFIHRRESQRCSALGTSNSATSADVKAKLDHSKRVLEACQRGVSTPKAVTAPARPDSPNGAQAAGARDAPGNGAKARAEAAGSTGSKASKSSTATPEQPKVVVSPQPAAAPAAKKKLKPSRSGSSDMCNPGLHVVTRQPAKGKLLKAQTPDLGRESAGHDRKPDKAVTAPVSEVGTMAHQKGATAPAAKARLVNPDPADRPTDVPLAPAAGALVAPAAPVTDDTSEKPFELPSPTPSQPSLPSSGNDDGFLLPNRSSEAPMELLSQHDTQLNDDAGVASMNGVLMASAATPTCAATTSIVRCAVSMSGSGVEDKKPVEGCTFFWRFPFIN
eukprot:TRINITY_DN121431_c0_g1_i1.p1 TRINITY_DN121431_c0_g1~~TRINITY_DN121431_c0_g1_i1.p1  ORF type:complete len:861 (+),score=152.44 TRINITY_DN121431_c0_g1_i1:282-2864(+)